MLRRKAKTGNREKQCYLGNLTLVTFFLFFLPYLKTQLRTKY